MKILQVTPAFVPSKFVGIRAVSYILSKTLAKRGHEVTVYTTYADIGYSRSKDVHGARNVDGIDVRYFRNLSNLLAWKHHLWSPIGVIKAMKKEIKTFDIIHIHDFRSIQNIIVHHYAKKYGVPYILQAHGSLPRIIEKQRLKKLYDWVWGNKIIKDTFKVIALTKTEAEQYKKMGVDEDKIEIVPNGIDLSEYENLPKKGGVRRKYKIKDDEKIILYLGRIHKIKGIDLLVKAFADLVNELDNIRLVIAGPDDGFLSTLKRQIGDLNIGDKTLFTGPLYGRDKMEAYVDADVYVLPSIYETFPNTVLEAMVCGTPVLATPVGAIPDIIKDRETGFIMENNSPECIAKNVIRSLNHSDLERIAENSRKLVEREFTYERAVDRWREILESI